MLRTRTSVSAALSRRPWSRQWTIQGLDVSAWQTSVDWPRLADDGARFAYIELAEGDHADTVYVATGLNFPDALSAGAAGGALGVPVILVPGIDGSLDAQTGQLIQELGLRESSSPVVRRRCRLASRRG